MGYYLTTTDESCSPKSDYGAFWMKDLGPDLSSSLQGAGGIGGLLSVVSGSSAQSYTVLGDANGNVTELVDSNAAVVAHYEYDPYGNTLVQTGTFAADNPFRFSTKYWDSATRLYYYGYRYYSSGLGRWVGRDPLGVGEPNGIDKSIYVFVSNDPVGTTDSFGLWGRDVHFDDTKKWGEELKMPSTGASFIAASDDLVDFDFDPTKITEANWKWHFNRASGGVDTRLQLMADELRAAMLDCDWKHTGNDNMPSAAEHLGRSLHPLQDWVAHGDCNRQKEMPSLRGYRTDEMRFYWHNWPNAGAPDDKALDSDGPDGRATLGFMAFRMKFSNGDQQWVAKFHSGNHRIKLTESKTKNELADFINSVRTNGKPCGLCRKTFLEP